MAGARTWSTWGSGATRPDQGSAQAANKIGVISGCWAAALSGLRDRRPGCYPGGMAGDALIARTVEIRGVPGNGPGRGGPALAGDAGASLLAGSCARPGGGGA